MSRLAYPNVLKYTFEIPVNMDHLPDKETVDIITRSINSAVAKVVNEILHEILEKYETDTSLSTRTISVNDVVYDVQPPKKHWFKFKRND
jgi:hypothetical protein